MLLRMALFFLNYPVRISQKSCRATADFTWELIPRYDGSEEYSLRVDTREYTDSDIVLSERLDSKTMCSLSLKFENDVLTWMQYRETKID